MRRQTKSAIDARHAGSAGRVGVTFFFIVWCTIPTVMLVLMVVQGVRDAAPWFWKSTDCRIVESGVAEEAGDRYALSVRYEYGVGGATAVETAPLTGTTVARGYRGDGDYSKAQRLAIRYAPGARATCYVNPSDPDEAVLTREVPGTLLMLPLPLLFIAIGAAVLWFTWRGKPSDAPEKAPAPLSADAAGHAAGRGGWIATAVFGVFFLFGAGLLVALGGSVLDVFAARGWTPVLATVVSSNVRTHHGDSTTYSVNVLYAYSVNGREYRSNRYGFMGGSDSGYRGKREVVYRYTWGTRFTAYVNPADPVDAVIERGFTTDMLLLLVPAGFMGVGAVGAYFTARHARRASAAANAASTTAGRPAPAGRYVVPSRPTRASAGATTLKPRQSASAKFVGIGLFALFWNGVVSVFAYQVVSGWASPGRPGACVVVFLVPFALVGVGMFVAAVHALLTLMNPRCNLTIDRGDLALGGAAEFRWRFSGRYDRIHRLVLRVEGREEATYRQGTNTSTDKNVFYVQELTDTSRAVDIHAGKARWAVPADSMHSFTAPNNQIAWVLCLHAHIAGWPDVKDEYVLAVAPVPAKTFPPAPPAGGDDSRPTGPVAARPSPADEGESERDSRNAGAESPWN